MRFDEYVALDAMALAEAIGSGQVTARDVVAAAIDRIEATNPSINAVVTKTYDRAIERVESGPLDGPFGGVPFLIKDLDDVKGVPTRKGSRSLRWHVAQDNGPLVQSYVDGGLVVLGKTNTPEFGITPYTEPEAAGPTRNPWNLARSPGGSSGGSGAAVAAGMVPAAHGGDGGGSIRIPAANCGLFGLKPSAGRVGRGASPTASWLGLVQNHVLSRSVRDSAALLDLVHGTMPGEQAAAPPAVRPFLDEVGADPGSLRVGLVTGGVFHDDIDPECVSAVRQAGTLLENLGHRVVGVDLPVDRGRWKSAFLTHVVSCVAQTIAEGAEQSGSKADPNDFELATWMSGLVGRRLTVTDLTEALVVRDEAARTMAEVMKDLDVLVTSTMASPPLEIGALQPSAAEVRVLEGLKRVPAKPALMAMFRQLADVALAPIPNTPIFNMTGQPAMSVPLHWTPDGLPVGVQFASRYGDEATLFRLAAQLESAAPWFDRMPDVSV